MCGGLDGPGQRYVMEMAERGGPPSCDPVGFHGYGPTPETSENCIRKV